MTDRVDYKEIFETLGRPVVIADEEGDLLCANAAARRFLGVEHIGDVRLHLEGRETLSSMRLTLGATEFFLADVDIIGAARPVCSISVAPLESGCLRVAFVEDDPDSEAPSVRMMRALGAATEHASLFDDPTELLALLGSCLADVFPDYAFRLELWRRGDALASHERGFDLSQAERTDVAAIPATEGAVSEGEYLWRESHAAERLRFEEARAFDGGLQIETLRSRGFSEAEREALAMFMHMLSYICARYIAPEKKKRRQARADDTILSPILDQLHAAVALCDARRAVRSCNEAFAKLIGFTPEELSGRDVLLFFDEDVRAEIRSAAAAVMSGTPTEPISAHIGHSPRPLSVRIAPVNDADGVRAHQTGQRGFLVIAQANAVSLDELEDKFVRAEQLMQLGQLATGLAHELKNPLTSILNYADYLLRKYRGQFFESRDSERLVSIIEGVERIDQFVRDLVTLARPNDAEASPERLDLHRVIRRACMLCEVSLEQHRVEIVHQLNAASPHVLGVEPQIVQVFVNLLTNAAAAMPERGGRVVIATEVCSPKRGPSQIVCTISDDGHGMDTETQERIFEPFYTTRKSTGGSGLGLPLVAAIIGRHAGDVDVASTVGEGTTFTLRLPLIDELTVGHVDA